MVRALRIRKGRDDEVAVGFAKAIRANYRIENGEYVHERPDRKQYISSTSELYEWQDGNDEGEDILILSNPSRVDSVEVVEVVGNTYILDLRVCWPRGSLDNEDSRMRSMAVTFNEDDLVEHAHFLL